MGKKDESGPLSGRLADVLYTLGLITADEGQLYHLLSSEEMEEFEGWLKVHFSHKEIM